MLVAIVIALLIALPLTELYLMIQVGDVIGVLPTVFLVLALSISGAFVLRYQGRDAWRRFTYALRDGRTPTREVSDGLLIFLGGLLLLVPGFLTAAVGLIVLFPPTRAIFRKLLERRVERRIASGSATFFDFRSRASAQRSYDVEGTAVDLDGKVIDR